MEINDIIKHYLHVLNPEPMYGFNNFAFDKLFTTAKFRAMLYNRISKLYLIYIDEHDEQDFGEFFDNDHYIYEKATYGPPIWDSWYSAILCASEEDLNL